MVDDGAFVAVIRIDIGDKPVNRFELRLGIGALPPTCTISIPIEYEFMP